MPKVNEVIWALQIQINKKGTGNKATKGCKNKQEEEIEKLTVGSQLLFS